MNDYAYWISAISILSAMIGTFLSLFLTIPYVGISFLIDRNKLMALKRKTRWAKRGNYLIAAGAAGQFISMIIRIF
jgi:hypothetical protein